MSGRVDELAAALGNGEAKRVLDRPVLNLLGPRQPGQDREPGGVSGGPSEWPQLVGVEVRA